MDGQTGKGVLRSIFLPVEDMLFLMMVYNSLSLHKKKFCQLDLDFQALISVFYYSMDGISQKLPQWHRCVEISVYQEIVCLGFICAEWEQIKLSPVAVTVVFSASFIQEEV